MFKVNNNDTIGVVLVSWTYFTPCSSVSIVNIEHIIADWDCSGVSNVEFEQVNASWEALQF